MSDKALRRFSGLRAFSNLVVGLAVLAALDWAWAWWRGQLTFGCSAAWALGSEAVMAVAGMGGLLIAMLGIMLGGSRHPLTGFGGLLMAAGLIGGAMLPEVLEPVCGRP